MIKTFAIAAFVIGFIANYANAAWNVYSTNAPCKVDVESWHYATENDTNGYDGADDPDRIRTVGEDYTLLDNIAGNSDYNIISINIPTRFHGLAGKLSYPTMYVTVWSMHESDPTQDFYFHSNAIAITPDIAGGDEAFYPIGIVIDGNNGEPQQAPVPVKHRSFAVDIEIVAAPGVQHEVSRIKMNTSRNFNESEGGCAH